MRTKNSKDTAQEEGADILSDAANVSHNGSKALLKPQFFVKPNKQRISIGDIKDQF